MRCDVGQMNQIDVLHDDVLLEIFDFYVDTGPSLLTEYEEGIPSYESKKAIEEWQLLVHVCRRWRSLVLGSRRRLNLRLYCTSETPIREKLDVWPALPLIVDSGGIMGLSSDTDNIVAALGQSNRISQIALYFADWKLEEVLAALQVPFPELTNLRVSSFGTQPPTIPDSFLDLYAPRLQYFQLHGLPFPGLPKLLLSATHLVELKLTNIPRSWYISPEAMVALISVLSGLRILSLEFQTPHSLPANGWESQSLPLPKRSILPALDKFYFEGVSEYLEDLVNRIEAPQLDEIDIIFFNQFDFDCPLLAQFINRSPTLSAPDEAHASLQFDDFLANITLLAQFRTIKIGISCGIPDRQLSSVVRICNSPLHPLSAVEDLYIVHRDQQLIWKNYTIENAHWLQLLLPFTAVKDLYLSEEFGPGIAAALQELVGARITEVLPSLQNIFVKGLEPSGSFQENTGQFVAARQLSDRPVAISFWDLDHYMPRELR